jgi:hypothetical protein
MRFAGKMDFRPATPHLLAAGEWPSKASPANAAGLRPGETTLVVPTPELLEWVVRYPNGTFDWRGKVSLCLKGSGLRRPLSPTVSWRGCTRVV